MEQNLILTLGLLTILLSSCGGFDDEYYVCDDGEVVKYSYQCKEYFDGCAYNNPPCSYGYECIDNSCELMQGCLYNNPPCEEGYFCLDNECILYEDNNNDTSDYRFTYYENVEPYQSVYCTKIDPFDITIRSATADAIRTHAGSYSYSQLFDIYDWVKKEIIYQNVPLGGIPYPPQETLITKSGDCKNQAVLIASMIGAIGGTAKVVVDPICEHAYTIVYFGEEENLNSFVDAVANHYGNEVYVNYFTMDGGIWVIFDTAGGWYPGDTLPECYGEREVYYITSCLTCVNTYSKMPYTYMDKCYSECPGGTISTTDYSCGACEQGYYSCNNECLKCPDGYYLATDCLCYRK